MAYRLVLSIILTLNIAACGQFKTGNLDVSQVGQSSQSLDEINFDDSDPLSPLTNFKADGNGDLLLGDKKIIKIQYVVSPLFMGKIDFQIDRSGLTGISGEEDVLLSLNPSSLEVTAGETINLELTLESRVKAPSFESRNIGLVAMPEGRTELRAEIPVRVSPTLEIQLKGCEFQNNQALDNCWDRPGSVDLRPHSADIQLRFYNCDTGGGHIIHGAGAIPHGDRQNPLPMAASPNDGMCGGMYQVNIPGDTTNRGVYYMHDTQGSAQARVINFGINTPLVAAKATVADAFDRGPSNTGETCLNDGSEDISAK